MVGGRVGFYELEKSDFVLFKPRFYLKQSSYFTIIVGALDISTLQSLKCGEGDLSAQCERT